MKCPPFLKEARSQIAELQRQREQHVKFSPEWKKINKAVAKTYAKAHRRSENWARHCAIEIVARYGVISLEDLKLVNMTRSTRGTIESPGKGVAQKKGLNREPPRCQLQLTGLLDLREGGRSWTQSMEGQPQRFL